MSKVLFLPRLSEDRLRRQFRPVAGAQLTSIDLHRICAELERTNGHVVYASVVRDTEIWLKVVNVDSWNSSWRNPVAQMEEEAKSMLAQREEKQLRSNAA